MAWSLAVVALAIAQSAPGAGAPVAPPRPAPPAAPGAGPAPEADRLDGLASFYGGGYHGRPTASGEPFDMHALTAAHCTLPFGTVVRVRNLSNGRSVVVRINDRGPFGDPRRVIDLSYAAALELRMIGAGLAPVRLEVIQRGDGRRFRNRTIPAKSASPPVSRAR